MNIKIFMHTLSSLSAFFVQLIDFLIGIDQISFIQIIFSYFYRRNHCRMLTEAGFVSNSKLQKNKFHFKYIELKYLYIKYRESVDRPFNYHPSNFDIIFGHRILNHIRILRLYKLQCFSHTTENRHYLL